jgi:hypothetical protein
MWLRADLQIIGRSWRAILFLISFAMLPMGLQAQAWTWTNSDIEATGGESPAITVDSDENLHVAYRVVQGGLLRYGFRPAGDSKWFKMTLDQGNIIFSTGITIDPAGNPHICYTPNVLKYAHFDGKKWFSQEVDQGSGLVGYVCSIRVNPQGSPMITWYLPAGGFRYAILRDGTWLATGLDGNPNDYAGKWNSMVLDADANPQIAYSDFPGGQLRYLKYDGKGWIRTVLHAQNDDPGGAKGMGASIVLDPQGNPWISYYDEQSLRVIHFVDGKPVKKTVEKLPPFVNWGWKEFHSDIALDHNGNPHIVFESLQGLEHAWWDGSKWSLQIILAPSIISFFDNAMVMDKNDVIYVAYKDPLDGSLKLAEGRPAHAAQAISNSEKPGPTH